MSAIGGDKAIHLLTDGASVKAETGIPSRWNTAQSAGGQGASAPVT